MAQPQIKEAPERWIASPQGRQVIYLVLAFLAALATALGFITEEQGNTILENIVGIASIFGFSLAAANKPKPAAEAQAEYVEEDLER